MKISVLIPTRKRARLLVGIIRSLLDNISNDNDIEILLRFDDDDLDTVTAVKESVKQEIGNDNSRKIKYFIGPRYGWPGMNRYFNELASNAEGDWLMVFNDDALMQTKNWDKEIEKYNGQMVIWPSWFTTLPRKVFEIWGHFSLCVQLDTSISEIVGILGKMGYHIRVDLPISIIHDGRNIPEGDVTFAEKDYQSDHYNIKYELSRRRDAKLLKEYIDTGEIKRNMNIDEDIGVDIDKLLDIGEIKHNADIDANIDKLIHSSEKKKIDRSLYHHNDQINIQKNEYELLAKIRPDVVTYPLFKLICHIIPFHNSVPHIFKLMNLARYSKIGILEIGTGQGEGTVALGIGAKMYGGNNPKLTTIDKTQPKSQAIGFFELFKELLPSDNRIIVGEPKSFPFNEPIDLLCVNGNITPEDIYIICNKYIPLITKDGIVIFSNTGCREVTFAILKYLDDSNTKYRVLSPDIIDTNSKFLYNNVGIGAIRVV